MITRRLRREWNQRRSESAVHLREEWERCARLTSGGSCPVISSWDTLDWEILDRLRRRFLEGDAGGADYWTSRADLEHYEATFAQRIGWKWDAVLRELSLRGWQPPAGPLLDWSCGSGIAGRRLVAAFGTEHFGTLHVRDRSPLAERFAAERARQQFPGLTVHGSEAPAPYKTLLVSHVLNELDAPGREAVRELARQAEAILWVEPGTHRDSRDLIGFREELLAAGFDAVAPCTHRARCGMLNAHNAPHWCHLFAEPPPHVLDDARWTAFARRAGIDLRATPYSFLVLARGHGEPDAGWTRAVGRPRVYKGYAKILDCSREDVAELPLQKRDHKELFRALKKGRCPTLLKTRDGAKGWKIVEEARYTASQDG